MVCAALAAMAEKASSTGKISMRKSHTVILLYQIVISGACSKRSCSSGHIVPKKLRKRQKKKLKDEYFRAALMNICKLNIIL